MFEFQYEGLTTHVSDDDGIATVAVTEPTYCTILTSNYLPKALSLADSLRRHQGGAVLKILLVDIAHRSDLPEAEGVEFLSTAELGVSDREILDLAAIYGLVEFATAVKPLLLMALLEEAEQVFYLDPDTYVTAPMVELPGELEKSGGGILLTPHFLLPTPSDRHINEGHMLYVGVFNLGFCGVDRRARGFLEWWWGHLRRECLSEPLSGLFVDQKWVDIGSTLFDAASLRHSGYNLGIGNLPERPLARDDDGFYNAANGDRLRLFHFHAFDARTPDRLSARFDHSSESLLSDTSAILALCHEYAEKVIAFEGSLAAPPPYPYATDTRGRRLSRQLRRAYRLDPELGSLPSPFVAAEADEFDTWRRGAWRPISRGLLDDTAKSVRIVLPEQYDRLRGRFPDAVNKLRSRFSGGTGMWR